MAFGNDVVGGITLIRPAIQSANYVPGVSGWSINRDGSAEFATGTFRGPVVVIDPTTGNVLASIGANGNISGQNFFATGDVIIGSLSVLAAITASGRGVVGRFSTNGTVPNIPGANVLTDIMWVPWIVDATRMYRLSCSTGLINNTNSVNSENFDARLVVTQPGGFTGTAVSDRFPDVFPGIHKEIYIETVMTFSASGPATVKLQMSNDSSSTAYPIVTSNNMILLVEDIGPNNGITGGGTGSPSGSTQFTTKYTATVSDTFTGAGARENDANNMYTRTLSGRTNGQETALWVFPGATIRTDISGATIQSARLWMYCTNSSGASGGCNISYVTNTTIPSSKPSTGSDAANHSSDWPVPGWGSIDISGPLVSSIQAGKNAVFLDSAIITGSASFYGAGQAGFEPYIQITYTK
jgi:hypothetical protein